MASGKRGGRRRDAEKRPAFGRAPAAGPGLIDDPEESTAGSVGKQLAALAARLKKGDTSFLKREDAAPPIVASMPPRETSFGDCAQFPYLVSLYKTSEDDPGYPYYDRFQYWSKNPPKMGAITTDFLCEFNRPLATIVGGDLRDKGSPNPLPGAYDTVSWDDFDNPGEVTGIPFAVRVRHYLPGEQGTAVLADEPLTAEGDSQQRARTVLLNQGVPSVPPDQFAPGQYRSSVVFEFPLPQRAVALEFGYHALNDPPEPIQSAGVILYAFDQNGQEVTHSGADRIDPQIDSNTGLILLIPNSVANRVGVRDEFGRISSVELRFETVNADGPRGVRIVEEQIVYRVWSEALPPAAILADRAVNQSGMGATPRSTVNVRLPFACDRAIAFIRGFRIEFLDNLREHRWSRVAAAIETASGGVPVFEVEPGGMISFVVGGDPTDGGDALHQITLFYTVLAWDSRQIELLPVEAGYASGMIQNVEDHNYCYQTIRNPPGGYQAPVGVLHSFDIEFGSGGAQGINDIWLAVGRSSGRTCRLDNDEISLTYNPPGLTPTFRYAPNDLTLIWDVCSVFVGHDRDAHSVTTIGSILIGRSLVFQDPGPLYVGPDPNDLPSWFQRYILGYDPYGPLPTRANIDSYFFAAGFCYPPFGKTGLDMAFLGLESFYFRPEDKIQRLDCEALPVSFDGQDLWWADGGGSLPNHGWFGYPNFGALVRLNRVVGPADLRTQDLAFASYVGSTSPPAEGGFGSIRNSGGAAILLSAVAAGKKPSDDRFDYSFYWQGKAVTLAALRRDLPIMLRPGDALLIGGTYSPEGIAGDPNAEPPIPADVGSLRFRTSSPTQPEIAIRAVGIARPAHADAASTPVR